MRSKFNVFSSVCYHPAVITCRTQLNDRIVVKLRSLERRREHSGGESKNFCLPYGPSFTFSFSHFTLVPCGNKEKTMLNFTW